MHRNRLCCCLAILALGACSGEPGGDIGSRAMAIASTPTLVSPSGTASQSPTYTWNASSTGDAPNGYDLVVHSYDNNTTYVNTSYTPTEVGCPTHTGTCSITPSVTLPTQNYYWWVRATATTGNSAWSSPLIFTAQAAQPPPAPVLTSPRVIAGTSPSYVWAASTGATSYDIVVYSYDDSMTYVNTTYSAANLGCDGGGTCTASPGATLPADQTYYWWVRATNGVGTGNWSTPGIFQADDEAIVPAAPTLSSPSGNIQGSPTFQWAATATAAAYELVVYSYNDSTTYVSQVYLDDNLGCNGGTGTCSVTPTATLTPNQQYYWWVRALNGAGAGAWSSPLIFKNTSLVSPSGTIGNTQPTYTWNATASATSYDIVVYSYATSTTYVNTTVDATSAGCPAGTGNCSTTPSVTLPTGIQFTWWVRPNGGVYSVPLTFTVVTP